MIFNAEIERSLRRRRSKGKDGRSRTSTSTGRSRRRRSATSSPRSSPRTAPHAVAHVLDTIKTLGFRYGTRAGVTISKNDIVIPPNKEQILAGYEERVRRVADAYDQGLITESERHEQITSIWTEATDEVANAMVDNLDRAQPDLR